MSARARVGYALVAVAACSWGAWPLILRHAPMDASLQSAVVMLVLTLVSGPFMLKDRSPERATWRDWLGVAWLGVSDAGNIALFFAAYQRTSVAIAVLTHYLTPIFVALAAPFVLGERAKPRTYGAVAIAFVGLCLLLEPWRTSANGFTGAALGAGSAVFYASNVLTNKRLAKAFSGSELMFFHGLVSVPILFALVPLSQYGRIEASALLVVLAGALGPGALAGLFFVWGLRRIPASHASTLSLFEPLVAVILAAAVMGERVGGAGVLGGLLILVGAVLVIFAERKVE
ncbi:MAG: DMT family transporter [Deltaproteobacteria bacterium]|nr:DMT family transporter [Deltaproteobacteria bacterium]